jgi:hypothetical protein
MTKSAKRKPFGAGSYDLFPWGFLEATVGPRQARRVRIDRAPFSYGVRLTALQLDRIARTCAAAAAWKRRGP